MARLTGELRELTSQPVAVAGYVEEPTGETFRQAWQVRDEPARRQLMLSAGFRVEAAMISGLPYVVTFIDDDLARRAGLAASGQVVSAPDLGQLREEMRHMAEGIAEVAARDGVGPLRVNVPRSGPPTLEIRKGATG